MNYPRSYPVQNVLPVNSPHFYGMSTLTYCPGLAPGAYGFNPNSTMFPPRALQAPSQPEKLITAKRRAMKEPPKPLLVNAYTGAPNLADGIYEVYRPLLGSPVGRHYGVLIVTCGAVIARDLRQGEPPRRVSFRAFAEGLNVFVAKYIPPGPDMQAALQRLQEAQIHHAEWNLWENNCEHFSAYVVRGERKSDQINGVKVVGGLAVFALIVGAAAR